MIYRNMLLKKTCFYTPPPRKGWVPISKVKVTAGSDPQKLTFFQILNFWTFCNWIWYSGASSWAGVFFDKFWLLWSGQGHSVGSDPQGIFPIICLNHLTLNVWVPIFKVTLGIVVHHHEPECCVTIFFKLLCLRSRQGFKSSANLFFCFLTVSSKPSFMKLGMLVYHHDLEHHANGFCSYPQGHSAGWNPEINKLFVPHLLDFCYQ